MTKRPTPLSRGDRARAFRRQLDPTAWCALECLVEWSEDGVTATASVRGVAEELAVAKNTAHRAMAALARAGLIEPIQERDANGRFRTGRYRLHLGDVLTTIAVPQPRRTRHHANPTPAPAQLSLLTPA